MGTPPFSPDDRVGPYIISDFFNVGGMGVIYSIRDESLLIKAPFADSDPSVFEQFRQEIDILCRLCHPGIIKVVDRGECGHIPWYAMPRLRGKSLRHLLKSGHSLDIRQAVNIVLRIARIIAYAHNCTPPIWHCDLKPENVFFQDGRILLLDFGLARTSGQIMSPAGTLPYMAPEQLRGSADARSDVYALGVILYEMLCGATPFSRQSANKGEVLLDILNMELPVPRLENIAPSVASICEKALEKRSDRRYANAGEMAAEIEMRCRKYIKVT